MYSRTSWLQGVDPEVSSDTPLQHTSWQYLPVELREVLSKHLLFRGATASKTTVKPLDRVKRLSNGATGTVLAVNDNKPGDVDLAVLWDQPHEGCRLFEVDLGDIHTTNESLSKEQEKEAKEALHQFKQDRKQYEDAFEDKLKNSGKTNYEKTNEEDEQKGPRHDESHEEATQEASA